MTDKKGISHYKDWIYVILFIVTVISFVGKAALLSDQVRRNSEAIENAKLEVLVYQIGEIEKKVDRILEIID